MDIKIVDKKPLTLAEVSKTIGVLGKKAELPAIQQKALTFAKNFSKTTEANATKLAEELRTLKIPMFSEDHIVQIANVMPRDLSELKSIFVSSKTTISPENFNKILDVINKYSKK